MSLNLPQAVSPPWSNDVKKVAAANGVDDYLLPLLEITQTIFPTTRQLKVAIENDEEVEEDWRIVYVVEVSLTVPDGVRTVHQWYKQLFECCPPTAACFFRLGLRMLD
jgi:hypothetical protein